VVVLAAMTQSLAIAIKIGIQLIGSCAWDPGKSFGLSVERFNGEENAVELVRAAWKYNVLHLRYGKESFAILARFHSGSATLGLPVLRVVLSSLPVPR
jgi:hypothetical protein